MLEWIVPVAAVVAGFWCVLSLDRTRWWPSGLRLPDLHGVGTEVGDGDRESSSSVAVVVPARDEAGVLRQTLPSLLCQHADFQSLVLVDDRSTDGTSLLARELAAELDEGPKFRVVAPATPPAGWSGKLHALQEGIRTVAGEGGAAASPDWLLFTDADIRHGEGSVRRLLAKTAEGDYELVSIMARLRAESFWEKLLIPPFVYFFQLLYPFRRVANPASRVAAAAGGCVLVRRSRLAESGGLEAMKGAVIDDVTLAKQVKRSGGRCWLGLDPGIVSVRSYGSFREIADMVARTAFTQLRFHYSLVALTFVFLGLFFVSPPVLALTGLLLGNWITLGLGLLAWAIQVASVLPVVVYHRVPPCFAATLPVAAALYGYMTGLSAWRHASGRGIRWRGRTIH